MLKHNKLYIKIFFFFFFFFCLIVFFKNPITSSTFYSMIKNNYTSDIDLYASCLYQYFNNGLNSLYLYYIVLSDYCILLSDSLSELEFEDLVNLKMPVEVTHIDFSSYDVALYQFFFTFLPIYISFVTLKTVVLLFIPVYLVHAYIEFYIWEWYVQNIDICVQVPEYSLYFLLSILPKLLTVVLGIAFFVLLERKEMASMQRRRGPNVVGTLGLLQPFADAFKALLKETIVPGHASKWLFIAASIFIFFISLISWIIFPFYKAAAMLDTDFNVLYAFAIGSLAVYGIIFAGWASNSKYAFLGGLRAVSQMISYEIVLMLVILIVAVFNNSINLHGMVYNQSGLWNIIPLSPLWVIFCIGMLAETNRAPFDMSEAEAELVAGYNIEYSGIEFALFFLGEYCNMLFMSSFSCILFFGGWLKPHTISAMLAGITWDIFWYSPALWFSLKLSLHMFLIIWVRAAFPRFRYDQLMRYNWKIIIPFLIVFLILEIVLHIIFRS